MRIHVLQHASFEGPARIQDWAQRGGHSLNITHLYQGDRLPRMEDVDLVVAMGGPMSVHDAASLKWMRSELSFLEAVIQKKKRVLGVCLGAQLIAHVLGAKVYANREKEIGWYPIDLNVPNARQTPLSVLPSRLDVFHWHGETYDLPPGAVHLARSQACENQAFAWKDHVIGLQFHIEVAMDDVERWLVQAPQEFERRGPFVMAPDDILDLTPLKVPAVHAALSRFLDGFAG